MDGHENGRMSYVINISSFADIQHVNYEKQEASQKGEVLNGSEGVLVD